jgi:hypothetical protein
MDVGKPLQTTYPVSRVCPACRSGEYTTVQPQAMVAYTYDRVCRVCSTRYTPPTPMWARVLFGVSGVGFLSIGLVALAELLYRLLTGEPQLFLLGRALAYVVALLVGCGCLYKAATK